MATIQLQTNQHRLITNLKHAFNQASMLGELLQNARRAGAQRIMVEVGEASITVTDDGCGIANLQSMIHIAESGWDSDLQVRENAFGMGVLSTLYFAERLSVHSLGNSFSARTADIVSGQPINVVQGTPRQGTSIHLEGVQAPLANNALLDWVSHQLARLCEAFPVRVTLNGQDIPRPLTDPSLAWRETEVGRVLVDLDASRYQWRSFLQGLPIGRLPILDKHQIVLLRDDMLARLPDRQHLLDEQVESVRIQAAIDAVIREALAEKKEQLADTDFVEHYASTCLSTGNPDLLNDVHFAPLEWFRDWYHNPPGYGRTWERYPAEGLTSREALLEVGVWSIETDDYADSEAEVYLCAKGAFLLEESQLDKGHWLFGAIRTLTPEQVIIRHQRVIHEDSSVYLADPWLALLLVEDLRVSLEGDTSQQPVNAVRRGEQLFLTKHARDVTRLVSDYVDNDLYDEAQEDADAASISTFIAVACSDNAAQAIQALLPTTLSNKPNPKLSGATVLLVFDESGKLISVES